MTKIFIYTGLVLLSCTNLAFASQVPIWSAGSFSGSLFGNSNVCNDCHPSWCRTGVGSFDPKMPCSQCHEIKPTINKVNGNVNNKFKVNDNEAIFNKNDPHKNLRAKK